ELRINERRFRAALQNSGTFVGEKFAGEEARWTFNAPFEGGRAVLPAEEGARLQATEDHVLATGEHARIEFQSAVGGEIRHYLFDMEPLRDGAGSIIGTAGAGTDVTEIKRVQAELARALAFRDRVMGVLSHDLRNPVGAIDALATLTLRKDDL